MKTDFHAEFRQQSLSDNAFVCERCWNSACSNLFSNGTTMVVLAALAIGIIVVALTACISWLVLEIALFVLRRSLAGIRDDPTIASPATVSAARPNQRVADEISFDTGLLERSA